MTRCVWQEDLETLMRMDYLEWDKLRNKTILITGGTGLIGSCLIKSLVYANRKLCLKIRILALVRNPDRLKTVLWEEIKTGEIELIQSDVIRLPDVNGKIHFIIHGASPTASRYFVERPVETIKTAVIGTVNLLELAVSKEVESFVYLSSMEVYGAPKTEKLLSEADVDYLNPLVIRNCYPESKRLCEALCSAYANEYGLHAMSIRLSQTFGPGVAADDKRVFAEFARCIMEEKDLVLLTDGGSKHCYLYTMDAVSAILTVLFRGIAGRAYNAGNPDSYCSILEMAKMAAHHLGKGRVNVVFSKEGDTGKFPPPHYYHLNMEAIFQLGWRPVRGLLEMSERLIAEMAGTKEGENAAYKA